ncbi:MAG TPA: ABC transporter permease [Solirubrobacteraceae bacterium]|nr:ABC transporter permease [Solirubrobacteraceae bacterium]
MRETLIIARHAVQETIRRRVFVVVLVLTILFLALFTVASAKAFAAEGSFQFGSNGPVGPAGVASLTTVTLLGLGVFGSLFLAAVLGVFLTVGAVAGDAERGLLQPLVVRPLGRRQFLLGRLVGAAAVSIAYVTVLYAVVLVIVHQAGGQWPDFIVGPAVALMGAVTILVAMSLLGSVFLSTMANGIAMFMLYGAGLVSGLLASIGAALNAHTVQTISHDITIALPFEGLYEAAVHSFASNAAGLARVAVNLGPFGAAQAGSTFFYLWAVVYFGLAAMIATAGFERRDL